MLCLTYLQIKWLFEILFIVLHQRMWLQWVATRHSLVQTIKSHLPITVDSRYLDPSYLDPITYVELISKSRLFSLCIYCISRWLSWIRRPTGDQEVAGSTPAEVGNILSWRLIMKYFLRSFSPFRWFKKGSCQFLAKGCAQYWLTA